MEYYGIDPEEEVLVETTDKGILISKYHRDLTCMVTGEYTKDNEIYGNGNIMLSKEGARQLLNELSERLGIDDKESQ